MKKVIGPIRRASIYGSVSYFGLVLINNSNLNLQAYGLLICQCL
jgi:hypothetical protein